MGFTSKTELFLFIFALFLLAQLYLNEECHGGRPPLFESLRYIP